jgi:hypothetical protein
MAATFPSCENVVFCLANGGRPSMDAATSPGVRDRLEILSALRRASARHRGGYRAGAHQHNSPASRPARGLWSRRTGTACAISALEPDPTSSPGTCNLLRAVDFARPRKEWVRIRSLMASDPSSWACQPGMTDRPGARPSPSARLNPSLKPQISNSPIPREITHLRL